MTEREPRNQRPGLRALALGSLLLAGELAAASSGNNLLEEVVVTASRVKERLLDSSASISVLTAEDLARMTGNGVADFLRDVPGLQVSDSGQAGLKRIRIRGEASRRSAILVDSHELSDHSEVGAPLTIHPDMLGRIEVIRGSGSVLYGSKALSGVTNLMTLKGGSAPLQATIKAGYDGTTGGDTLFTSLHGAQNSWSYRLAAANSEHGQRRTAAGRAENTAFDHRGYYGFLEKSAGSHTLGLTWDRFESSSEVFVEDAARTTFPLTDFALSTPRRDRERFGLDYYFEPGQGALDLLTLSAFTQDSLRTFISNTETVWYQRDIDTRSTLRSDGLLLQADWQPLGRHSLISGLQYSNDNVSQQRSVVTRSWVPAVAATGTEQIDDEATIRTVAAFVQDRWDLGDHLTAIIGARYYRVDGKLDASDRPGLVAAALDSDRHLIGSAGLNWASQPDSVWRLNVSEGYLYPSLMQLATGAYAGSSFVNPTRDLKPETSLNYELGWRLMSGPWTVDAALFHSDSSDYIDHLFCRPQDQCLDASDKIYRNIGASSARGLELYLGWQSPGGWARPYLNLTWMRRQNDFGDFETSETGIPTVAGRAGVVLEPGPAGPWPSLWADLYLRGESDSRLEEPGSRGIVVSERSGWATLNAALGMNLGPGDSLLLALELNNLLDRRYRESSENLLAPGRGVSLKATWNIN
ncbi:TonB-dependent receptor [Haliea sp. E1-2-M8]|uniref:TonB-dependent receptor plug domain-containing protein n=1 Tax=Haliea sp. E1-2-M8 TaxID=3064706 RepID=UPI00271E06EE|nr:TonB-dependent receptor [Haliea sp. E1-2-M8]MDO8860478.1 TonB-dependent receptor [Haliea sp. E1-2-M8]